MTTETFTASQNWVAPTGVSSTTAEVWGSGGAGGGQNLSSDGGGGGGGGAYSRATGIVVVPASSYKVTVGPAGIGVAGACGGMGTSSSFVSSSTVLAVGGVGGCPSTGTPPAGGLGGAATSGAGGLKWSGGQGEKGRDSNTGTGGYGGSSAGTGANGWSGPQTWSTATYPTASTPSGGGHGGDGGAAGANGSAPASGNGGGGGGSGDTTPAKTGGNGAVGKVILTYSKPSNAPSQNSPANSATGVSITPTFLMTATDPDTVADNLSYKVTIYSNSGCSSVVQTNDQAVSSTGWTGSDATCAANPTACYLSGTQGSFLTQTALSNSTQYWWKASAKDPDGNTAFTDSATCNTFTTVSANSAPTLSAQTIERTTLTLNENSYVWASSTVLVTDTNFCTDISNVSAKLYLASTTNTGTTCGYNGNNCYTASSCVATTTGNTCGASDTTVQYDCGFKIWYTAEATDASAPTWASSIWSVSATATDSVSNTGNATNTTQTVEVGTLNALALSGNIAYPQTNPNANTGATNQTVTVTNTGNTAIDAEISGDVMCTTYPTCPTNFFGPSQQKFGASNVTYASLANLLSATATPATIQINLAKPTSTTTPITIDLFWGIAIPLGKAAGIYTGQNIFTAILNI
ncbi:MAG: hypothetical protein HZC03_02315 [Candidatus Lloydbacteria bacterium]|nr:hypothetical protein [Candidatus Lloydbacteria bacterium]